MTDYILVKRETLQAAADAARKFCTKVQTGQARSVETYDDMIAVCNSLEPLLAAPCEPDAVVASTASGVHFLNSSYRAVCSMPVGTPLYAPKDAS